MAWVRVHNSTQNCTGTAKPQVPTSISNSSNASSRVIFMLPSNARYVARFCNSLIVPLAYGMATYTLDVAAFLSRMYMNNNIFI